MGDSGWLSILSPDPLINIFFGLYLAFAPGIDGRNQYGPAPSKNSTLVVLCGLILPVVMFIGIVAAIPPAYKEYTVRVKAAKPMSNHKPPHPRTEYKPKLNKDLSSAHFLEKMGAVFYYRVSAHIVVEKLFHHDILFFPCSFWSELRIIPIRS